MLSELLVTAASKTFDQMICKASRIGLSTQPTKIDQLQRHKKFKELSQLYPFPQTLGTLRSKDADGEDNVKKTIGLISKTTLRMSAGKAMSAGEHTL